MSSSHSPEGPLAPWRLPSELDRPDPSAEPPSYNQLDLISRRSSSTTVITENDEPAQPSAPPADDLPDTSGAPPSYDQYLNATRTDVPSANLDVDTCQPPAPPSYDQYMNIIGADVPTVPQSRPSAPAYNDVTSGADRDPSPPRYDTCCPDYD